MSDFLKKLKQSVETGEINKDVVDLHYEILHGADMDQKTKKDRANEDKLYVNEVLDFVNDQTVDNTGAFNDKIAEVNSYNEEMKNFIGGDVDMSEKLASEAKALKEFEESQKRKDLFELNKEHIRLLREENIQLANKIAKNNDLIEYLKKEVGLK